MTELTKEKSQSDSLMLCASEISALLCISRSSAYTLMRSKGFPTLYIGKRMLVPRNELEKWISNQISR